jgi:steroid 5-alpha reductase family enzyme
MSFIMVAGINLVAITAMMILGWIVSLVVRKVTFVDSLWGLGFVLIAWFTFFTTEGYLYRRLLLAGLTTAWGVRLCLHLTWRNWGHGEDPRYAAWREQAGANFWIFSLLKVFLPQAVFLWSISLCIQFGQLSPTPDHFTVYDVLGAAMWGIGFFFESIADYQLARFKADPSNKGKVMDRGLWAYSRHPNYFGETLIWWGLFVITLSTPNSWWAIISPVIITVVLLKMTGIALMERSIVDNRPGYREYIRRTNAFFPWIPKKEAS